MDCGDDRSSLETVAKQIFTHIAPLTRDFKVTMAIQIRQRIRSVHLYGSSRDFRPPLDTYRSGYSLTFVPSQSIRFKPSPFRPICTCVKVAGWSTFDTKPLDWERLKLRPPDLPPWRPNMPNHCPKQIRRVMLYLTQAHIRNSGI